jgi:transcriptional regulator with XRE-family HTH domain
MGFLSIIRRRRLREHVPIREIARRTGLSRDTIRKYLRSDTIERSLRFLIARASLIHRPINYWRG